MSKQTSKKTETVQATEPVVNTPKAAKSHKATKPAKEAAPTPAAAAPAAAAPAPVAVEAPTPAKKSGKKQAAPTPAPVTEGVVSTEAAASATPAEAQAATSDYSEFMTKLQQVSSLLSALKSEFRLLEKKSARQLKVSQKASAKRKQSSSNRAPSGFVQPTLISDELAGFLGKTKGSKMARTEVTREINAYIRTNNLQDKENGRRINADNNLSTLLKLKKGDELTYFNLQRYMSPHFAKTVKAVAAAVVSESA